MRRHHAATSIAAPPEEIWRTLTDGAAYPEWDASVDRIEGRIAPGETLRVHAGHIGMQEPSVQTDIQMVRQNFAIHGGSWLRGLKGEWRRANALFRSLLAEAPPKSISAQIQLLD